MNPFDIINNPFPALGDWLGSLLSGFLPRWAIDLLFIVLAVAGLIVLAVLTVLVHNWLERKVVGRIQDRLGPNRVGPLGVLQPVADVVKMLIKEDITPSGADRLVYNLAPILVVPPALLVFAVFPFAQGLIPVDLNIGFLYIVAISSTSTLAVLMAGWGSNNKYALLGGMRAVAQFVSYEIPQVLSAVGVIMLAGSLSMNRIVEAQSNIWFALLQPLGFIIFLISSVSEVKRSPFDIPEAESEIVAGYHIEYSGMKFAMFLLSEYIGAFAISAIGATLFLGGWQGPLLPGWVWFLAKTYALVFVLIWLRGTLPRLRIDQLMGFAWKFLVPLALLNVMVAGVGLSVAQSQGWWQAGLLGTLWTFIVFAVLNVAMVMLALILYRPRRKQPALAASGGR